MTNSTFNNHARKSDGNSGLDLLEMVMRERPDLRLMPAYFPEQGRSAQTLMFENEVFKAPKKESSVAMFKAEFKILQHLQGRGLKIPAVTIVARDETFFGMTRIRGNITSRSYVDAMQSSDRRELARDLARFMVGFETSFAGDELVLQNDGVLDTRPRTEKILAAIRHPGVQQMMGERLHDCCRHVSAYLEAVESRKDIILHHDLHSGNIMTDHQTNRMTGIVDFGFIAKAKPEAWFLALQSFYSRPFVEMLCEEYSKRSENKVTYKDVMQSRLCFSIESLHHCITRNDEGGVVKFKAEIAECAQELRAIMIKVAPVERRANTP